MQAAWSARLQGAWSLYAWAGLKMQSENLTTRSWKAGRKFPMPSFL